MRNPSLPFALLISVAAVACAAESSNEKVYKLGKNASAIQGGTLDTSTAHNYVVGVTNRYGGVCSGTLIAPNLVLTARHCVVPPDGQEAVTCADKFPSNVAPSAMGVTTSANLYRTKSYYAAKEIVTPPDTAFCGNDIALIILSENIPDSEAAPVTPVVQFSMTDTSKIGQKVVAMGYGITSPSANDSGQRRMRQDIDILCIPGDKTRECDGRMKSMVDSDKEFVTEGWVCSGDSGSGAFEQNSFEAGHPYVLGALSRGPQTDTECLAAIYTRTDAHADMIIKTAQKAADSGGYDAPEWTKPMSDTAAPSGTDCQGDTCTDTSATEPATTEPVTTKTTTSGCSTSGAGTGSNAFGVLALAAMTVLVTRRRRAPR